MYILIILNILWAGSYTVMKWGIDFMAPMHLIFFRMLVSVLVLFLFSYKQIQKLPKNILIRCVILGAIMAGTHTLGVIGMSKSFATDGALLYALEPIIAIVYARILLGERMKTNRKIALALALIGFTVLSDITSKDIFSNMTFIGNGLMLLGAVSDGLFSPVAKTAVANHSARLIMMVSLFFTTIFLLPFALMTPLKPETFSWQSMTTIFYLAVICTSIGWTFWIYFLKKYPVNVMAITIFVQPVVGPFISHFTLHEQISDRVWFGGGIILLAVLISMFKSRISETELIADVIAH